MKLPEGIDVFYVMMSLVFDKTKLYPLQLDVILISCELKGLTLGLDMLIYIYGKFVEVNGYDEQVAFIFKNCILNFMQMVWVVDVLKQLFSWSGSDFITVHQCAIP